MIAAIQSLSRRAVGHLRNRRSTEDVNHDQDAYDRPRIRVVDKAVVKSSSKAQRWFIARSLPHRSQELLQEQHNDTSNNISHDTDITTDLPLLYSLARGWAWEAVTFRCTSHPHEVDVTYRDHRGDTILHWVAFGRPPLETVKEILRICPKLAQTKNHSGTLPLHVACSYRASSMVIREIVTAYPEAVATPDGNGATPLHHLCDYGSGTGRETIASMKVLLRCSPYGMQSVMMTDHRYRRRPIFILNARKNIREQQSYLETIRCQRFRQRAIWEDVDWNRHLQHELSDRLEDDIGNICSGNHFMRLASCLVVAEYFNTISMQDQSNISASILDSFFVSDTDREDPSTPTTTPPPSEFQDDEKVSIVLHAFVHNTDCPPSMQEYAILLYEPFLSKPNPLPSYGRYDRSLLPLHVAASMYSEVVAVSGSTDRMSHLLSLLVDGCPTAASVRDTNGQLPLGLVFQRRRGGTNERAYRVHWSNGMQALIDAYPLALLDEDVILFIHRQQALWPYTLSAVSRNRSTLFSMIRSDPTLLFKFYHK